MTEKEIEEVLEEYGDINNYIKDEVYDYKRETTDFMDSVKYIFFAYLISKAGKKKFNKKIDEELKQYNKYISNKTSKGYETISYLVKYQDIGEYTPKEKKPLESVLKSFKEQLQIDSKSTKTANDKYIKYVKDYYKKTEKTLSKEYINEKAYLSKKVTDFDKVEKTVAYRYKGTGKIRAYFDIASYNSMVYNTNLTNKGWQETIDSAIELEQDIVYVPAHMYACEMCQQYQGKFYSLSEVNVGETFNGYKINSLDEALSGGLKHPNCTHDIIFPNSETKENNKYSSARWTDRYNAKQKKQALELKRSRLKNDNVIYNKLENQEMVDKNKQKIRKLNQKIKEQKELM